MALTMTRPTKHPRTGVYWVRKSVPAVLRPHIGKRELVESLRTKDPAEAKRKAPPIIAAFDAVIAEAKRRLALGESVQPVAPRPGEEDIRAAVRRWFYEQQREALNWPIPDDPEAVLETINTVEAGIANTEDGWSHAEPQLRAILKSYGFAAPPSALRAFGVELVRHAILDGLAIQRARVEGRADAETMHPALIGISPLAPAPARPSPPKPPLSAETLLAMWAAEAQPAPATLKRYGATFRHLTRILGFDDVRRITSEDVVKFKRTRLETEKRDPGTVADDVLAAGAVCNWAVKNGALEANPFARLAPKAERRGPPPRAPYDDEEAARILTAARQETGWLRWLPWLLCFTGARISELAELRRGDVREDGGVMILDIRPNDQRAGKNATFQRMLPLHPALITEGFLEYVAGLPADPSGPLFPSITPDPHGSRTTPATGKLGRWMRTTVGIKDPKKAPAHSWRHRMEDELRKVRAQPEVQDAITGRHNPRNAGAGYGRGFRGMPNEVLEDLQRIPSPLPPSG